jgi:hypothetical protein
MFLLAVSAIWWVMQVVPVLATIGGNDELFYGMVSEARQSSLFGRVSFHVNGDNDANFMLWMNPDNRKKFDQWFGPQRGFRIEARRSLGGEWLVSGLDCAYGGLDRQELLRWRIAMFVLSLGFAYLAILGLRWLGRDYHAFYRHRPWLRIPRKAD